MKREKKIVGCELGVHVRVACQILELCKSANCTLFVSRENCEAKAVKYPLEIASMALKHGEIIEISILGESETTEEKVLLQVLEALK